MRYHYVITIEIPGLGIATSDEVITVAEGETRSGIYRSVRDRLTRDMARHAGLDPAQLQAVTRVWSFEPDSL